MVHPRAAEVVQVHAQREMLNTDALEHGNCPDRQGLPKPRNKQ